MGTLNKQTSMSALSTFLSFDYFSVSSSEVMVSFSDTSPYIGLWSGQCAHFSFIFCQRKDLFIGNGLANAFFHSLSLSLSLSLTHTHTTHTRARAHTHKFMQSAFSKWFFINIFKNLYNRWFFEISIFASYLLFHFFFFRMEFLSVNLKRKKINHDNHCPLF